MKVNKSIYFKIILKDHWLIIKVNMVKIINIIILKVVII